MPLPLPSPLLLLLPFPVLVHAPVDRHFDRSCSRHHRERRSGEICFSTSTVRQPTPRTRLCSCRCPCRRRCSCSCRFPFSSTHQSTVISTEAAHGIIVSSAAEKSASLPPPFANPHRA